MEPNLMENEINYKKYMPLASLIVRNNYTAEENILVRSNLNAKLLQNRKFKFQKQQWSNYTNQTNTS